MTAAGARFIKGAQYGSAEGYFLHAGTVEWLEAQVAAIEAEAADRAVDEALSVGEVVRMLEGIRRAIEVMGEDGECSLRTIRGVQYVTKDDAMLAVDDYLGVMRFRAAALAAHLRGPRPEGEG